MNAFASAYFFNKQWTPHPFQEACWAAMAQGKSGLLNAPTGYGKTFAMWFGILDHYYRQDTGVGRRGLHTLWITPLRALSKEILLATQDVSRELELDYRIELRTGDTPTHDRQRQRRHPPQALITTPESVHLLLASKGYRSFFENLAFIIVDEWHELLGNKRGVLAELAIQHLRTIQPALMTWGISATIGNLAEAKSILTRDDGSALIRADIEKAIRLETLFPDELDKYPWSGHLGTRLAAKALDVIHANHTTLLFTNTRSQAEIWYQKLLEADIRLAGQLALHHGSLSEELRLWVEDMLRQGELKAVVCTSSLDLGVDFPAVDCVIQIGSPKGIARFLQRAGRSGHRPGAVSQIYFLPTHSLEIMEGASLTYAIGQHMIEERIPFIRSFDLLIQFMMTLAVSDGFRADALFDEVTRTHCFEKITRDEFDQCLLLITQGGNTLHGYDEFHKVVVEEGLYKVVSRKVAMQHRLSIGAIVSDMMMRVVFKSGKYLGVVEEWFISRLSVGDVFWFGGRSLELLYIRENAAVVKPSRATRAAVPSWLGGRFPISVDYGKSLRHVLDNPHSAYPELAFLRPLFDEQQARSHLPRENELLVEYNQSKYGYHLFVYPFEGKLVHEGMAAILAYRIGQAHPHSFSISSNDYGFELLSAEPFELDRQQVVQLFDPAALMHDINHGVNVEEMAKRTFRDIASISGLMFNGYPGKRQKTKHLQAHASLFFKVFAEYEPENLLYQQAFDEVYDLQLQMARMHRAFLRMQQQQLIYMKNDRFSPFAFPIFTESFRTRYSNEDWAKQLEKLKKELHVG
ncbi:ligase-associated DNA damage response DEXH box helicase [Parapedobacter lycopersici]|uniref:ligase-associated DNA damage response DEXH box helicase n=1 Tax=Parapedobacter lycopersici TaxID=1864939 RepID=UPI00214D2F5A|nr:ligase-associated DNA damage response DEXH box helicase [Parapedobacter lycopersici]